MNRGYVKIGQREQRRGISISTKVWLFSYRGQELVIFYWLDRNSVVFDRFDPVWVCCWGIIVAYDENDVRRCFGMLVLWIV